ncbi:MAG: chemotaxis protein CheB [Gammaproteobacteria bacterium]
MTTDTEGLHPATAAEPAAKQSARRSSQIDDDLVIVGIGASAGGLEALRGLLSGLPTDVNIAYVIAQHLHPTHRSMLIDLLRSHTKLEVVEAKNREPVCAGRVYVTPPGRNVSIANGRMKLTKTSREVGPKPSVDQFFTALAENVGERAVGIILSGTGSDGALGVRAIKAHGGFTMAQAIESAKFHGMPHAAINTGDVDLVLPPHRIGPELRDLLKHPRSAPLPLPEDDTLGDVQRILRLLLTRTGCDFSDYKPNTLNRRIQRRMAIHKLAELGEYLRYVEESPKEAWDLGRDILVSVTAFFRDPEAFQVLEKALVAILEKKERGGQIRVWVPGCATGEEAYSIAILLDKLLRSRPRGLSVQIFGTDLDENAILHARRGVYPITSLAGIDPALRKRCFISTQSAYQVIKPIREMVVFARHDLVKDPPFSHLDLITCRNVLIYFNSRLQQRIIPLFHQVIEPNGYLLLGKSESIVAFSELFEQVDRKWRLFRRRPETSSSAPGHDYHPYRIPISAPTATRKREQRHSMQEIINHAIADAYAPLAVLIDERMQVRHVRGDISAYLRLSAGDLDLNIVNLARDELRTDLRTLLYRVSRDHTPLKSRRLQVGTGPNVVRLSLHARPVRMSEEEGWLIAVIFQEELGDDIQEADVPVVDLSEDARIAELEKEVTDTREQLQTTVEELETTNEELQSINEELQSANEELHSANEELETSNEELQSANEELHTLNEALQIKSAEVAMTSADIENVLKSIGFPMLVVDRDLRITRATPTADQLFDLSSILSRPVVTGVPSTVSLPGLRSELLQVMETDQPLESELVQGNTIYWKRILPYYAEEGEIVGAILMFLDQTSLHTAEKALRERESYLAAILNNYLYGIISINETGCIESFNVAAERIFGYRASEAIGQNVNLLLPAPERDRHSGYIQRYLKTGESHIMGKSRRVVASNKAGKHITIHLTLTEWKEGGRRSFIGLIYAPDEQIILPPSPTPH